MSPSSNRSFNPHTSTVRDADDRPPIVTFYTGIPLPEDAVEFTGHLSDTIPADEFASTLSNTDIINRRFNCPAYSVIGDEQVTFGEGIETLQKAGDQLKSEHLALVGTVTDGSLLVITGRVEDQQLTDGRVKIVSNGYPSSTSRYAELIEQLPVPEITQTSTPHLPAVTIDVPMDASRTDMRLTDDIKHHVVDKENEMVVGLIVENPFRNFSIADHLSDGDTGLNAGLYALHENKLSEDIDASLEAYDEVYCPLETPHPIDEGMEYGIASTTIVELTPLTPEQRCWNAHITCKTLTPTSSTTEKISSKLLSLFSFDG